MRTIIVGGGASGASCAARLRRLDEQAEIIILEATDEISIANCGLPYYCSDVISDRDRMIVASPSTFSDLLNIEVRFNSKVTRINKENKSIVVNDEYELSYDNLVLALGASPLKPPIEGIDNPNIFTIRTLANADKIKSYIASNNVKNAVVIGGGFIGVEMAENLIELGLSTTLIEMAPQILAPVDSDIAAFAQNEMRSKGCKLILNDGVKAFRDKFIELNSGEKVDYDIAILAIGVRPETGIAKDAGLELGLGGSIKVNEYMETSYPNIWAAGDSVEVVDFVTNDKTLIPLAGPANRQGRIIADNIYSRQVSDNSQLIGQKVLEVREEGDVLVEKAVENSLHTRNNIYKSSLGTAVIKVFDKTIASVGKNEKQLKKLGVAYLKNIIQSNSHAGYYPDATPIFIKLLFTETGKILGAQAVGYEGVEKRIDIISTIIRMNGCVQDLIDAELCYAPPYSSAKDPINILGMSSQNILDGFYKPAYYEDLKESLIIDVRPEASYNLSHIEGAISIPATELRSRYNEIPKDKKVVLYCNKGFTSYVSNRILNQLGFTNIYSFCGGKSLYDEIIKDKKGITNINIENKTQSFSEDIKTLDCSGMQCPGPIMKLSNTLKEASNGEVFEIITTDEGFGNDIEGWCRTTKNTLLNVEHSKGKVIAKIKKGFDGQLMNLENKVISNDKNGQTIVVFSNDLDKALAAMIIANGAKASGKDVTMFFTFWGLNILRKSKSSVKGKSIIDKMFGLMMPKGASNLVLSKLNIFGLGTLMMKLVMKHKNVLSLEQLISQALASGVKIIACTMAMDIMGIKQEELIDGIEFGGVAKYISETDNANSNLFI